MEAVSFFETYVNIYQTAVYTDEAVVREQVVLSKILYIFNLVMHAACCYHLILLNLIIVIIYDEKDKLREFLVLQFIPLTCHSSNPYKTMLSVPLSSALMTGAVTVSETLDKNSFLIWLIT